jgi:WD40 repeat protein
MDNFRRRARVSRMEFAKHWAAVLDDYAIDLAWSPDGTLLAAASQSGSVMLFDAATGTVRHKLAGHEDGTNAIAFAPAFQMSEAGSQAAARAGLTSGSRPLTSALLATGGQDGLVRFWNATAGARTAETKPGGAWVEHLAWSGTGLLFAAAGKKLLALKPDGSIAHTFPDAPKTISALAVRPDGGACTAACFGHVVVWDAATFAAQKELPYGNAILALTWSPDSRWLIAGCQDNAVHLWVPAEDLELHMSGYETKLKELSFSHDSKWLATGGGRDACVWDCAGAGPEGREPLLLPHTARVCAVAFQNQHGLLATGDAGGVFTLWAPTRKNPMVAEVRMPAAATKFSWSPDDSLLAVGTGHGHVFVFRTA